MFSLYHRRIKRYVHGWYVFWLEVCIWWYTFKTCSTLSLLLQGRLPRSHMSTSLIWVTIHSSHTPCLVAPLFSPPFWSALQSTWKWETRVNEKRNCSQSMPPRWRPDMDWGTTINRNRILEIRFLTMTTNVTPSAEEEHCHVWIIFLKLNDTLTLALACHYIPAHVCFHVSNLSRQCM